MLPSLLENDVTGPIQLTILNTMAGRDFGAALDRHQALGLNLLDIKDGVFGKSVASMSRAEAQRAAAMIDQRGLSVYCMSTTLFDDDIEIGETPFRQRQFEPLAQALEIAAILKPRLIRLIAAKTSKRQEVHDSFAYVRAAHPWLLALYRDAIKQIGDAGFLPTIENETSDCLFSNVREIREFFAGFDPGGYARFTWDVVNLWQAGTYPTVEVYASLKEIIGYYHLKGGRHDTSNRELVWQSSLENASWPLGEITRQVVIDQVSPVICLNPPHGRRPEHRKDDWNVETDLVFVRDLLTSAYHETLE